MCSELSPGLVKKLRKQNITVSAAMERDVPGEEKSKVMFRRNKKNKKNTHHEVFVSRLPARKIGATYNYWRTLTPCGSRNRRKTRARRLPKVEFSKSFFWTGIIDSSRLCHVPKSNGSTTLIHQSAQQICP